MGFNSVQPCSICSWLCCCCFVGGYVWTKRSGVRLLIYLKTSLRKRTQTKLSKLRRLYLFMSRGGLSTSVWAIWTVTCCYYGDHGHHHRSRYNLTKRMQQWFLFTVLNNGGSFAMGDPLGSQSLCASGGRCERANHFHFHFHS